MEANHGHDRHRALFLLYVSRERDGSDIVLLHRMGPAGWIHALRVEATWHGLRGEKSDPGRGIEDKQRRDLATPRVQVQDDSLGAFPTR